jgi:SAM-dependent methyltransferase
MAQAPDFSPLAAEYARSRPRYPEALFDWLAEQVPRRELAWDAATGNGQAAASLATRFARVVATDVSSEQLRHAFPAPNVEYRQGRAEEVDLPPGSVDLTTVAAAIHWFDLARFGTTVLRVGRPRGVVAVWSYHVGRCADPTGPAGGVLHRLYHGVLRDDFAPGARLVDEGYASIELPGAPIAPPAFSAEAAWNLDQLEGFVRSWSGYATYRARTGTDPLALVADELAAAWGERARVHALRFPLHLKAWRLPA